jgi:hypothetical protein
MTGAVGYDPLLMLFPIRKIDGLPLHALTVRHEDLPSPHAIDVFFQHFINTHHHQVPASESSFLFDLAKGIIDLVMDPLTEFEEVHPISLSLHHGWRLFSCTRETIRQLQQ